MTKRMRTILQGAGSIVDICPASNGYEQFVPKGTVEERLNAVWSRVGQHIRDAAREVRSEPSAAQSKETA